VSDERDATTPNSPGPPWDNPVLDLVIVLVLLLIAIAGAALKRLVPSKPVARTIRLGAPQFAPLSEPDAADAARLLGTSIAQLMTEGGEETP
jgi:hypothetical protein